MRWIRLMLMLGLVLSLLGCSMFSETDVQRPIERSTMKMDDALIGHWRTNAHELNSYDLNRGVEHDVQTLATADQLFQDLNQEWLFRDGTLKMTRGDDIETFNYEVTEINDTNNTITIRIQESGATGKARTIELALNETNDRLFYATEVTLVDGPTVGGTLIFEYVTTT